MVSCGIDIESLSRVRRLYDSGTMPMGLFTDNERKEIDSYKTAALMFVAKEAVLKALGSGWFNTEIDAHDIELSCENGDAPTLVSFSRQAKASIRERRYDRYSIEFHYFDDNVLAVFTVMGPNDKKLKRRLVSVNRSGEHARELLSGEPLESVSLVSTANASTRKLGQVAVEQAVKKMCESGASHREGGVLQKNGSGAPVWVLKTPSIQTSGIRVIAVSVTHNRDYACGFVIGRH